MSQRQVLTYDELAALPAGSYVRITTKLTPSELAQDREAHQPGLIPWDATVLRVKPDSVELETDLLTFEVERRHFEEGKVEVVVFA